MISLTSLEVLNIEVDQSSKDAFTEISVDIDNGETLEKLRTEVKRVEKPDYLPEIANKEILRYVIVSFFVIDLMFKWHHTPKLSKFVKLYWIDIIAVFPFYLLFRVYFVARELIGAGEQIQKVLHEAVLLRETKILRQAGITSTFAKQGRIVQTIARSLRILRARWYITHWHIQKVSKGYRKAH